MASNLTLPPCLVLFCATSVCILTFSRAGSLKIVTWLFRTRFSFGCLLAVGIQYVLGALMYGLRIPERFFPGKFDVFVSYIRPVVALFVMWWCLSWATGRKDDKRPPNQIQTPSTKQGHSHQIFHLLVLGAAATHYAGVLNASRFWHQLEHSCDVVPILINYYNNMHVITIWHYITYSMVAIIGGRRGNRTIGLGQFILEMTRFCWCK